MDIILASQSPRRRELLTQIGLTFRVLAPGADETVPAGTPPAETVEELSRRKAAAAAALEGTEPLIIAADTVVALGDKVLGKPRGEEDAFAMLSALSGREHRVCTGVTVTRGGRTVIFHETTAVRFRPLPAEDIAAYIATGEPMDKAGAYGIQGRGALLVERIAGDYGNVVGLPLFRLGRVLAEDFGLPPFPA